MASITKLHVVNDPHQSLSKQIEAFRALLVDRGLIAEWITVDPSLAAFILDPVNGFVRPNRSMRESKLRRYSKAMHENNWRPTGESIMFSTRGILLNGYHRLTSCIRANAKFKTLVAFNIDEKALPNIDTGAQRGGQDALAFAGYPRATQRAGATRWYLILKSQTPYNRGLDLSNEEMLRAHLPMDADPLFHLAMKHADALYRVSKFFVAGAMVALLYIYLQENPAAVESFVKDALVNKGDAGKLFSRLQAIAAVNLGRIHENSRNARVIITLNAYCTKVRLRGRGSNAPPYWDSDSPFPEFKFR